MVSVVVNRLSREIFEQLQGIYDLRHILPYNPCDEDDVNFYQKLRYVTLKTQVCWLLPEKQLGLLERGDFLFHAHDYESYDLNYLKDLVDLVEDLINWVGFTLDEISQVAREVNLLTVPVTQLKPYQIAQVTHPEFREKLIDRFGRDDYKYLQPN